MEMKQAPLDDSELAKRVIDASPAGMVITDMSGTILSSNSQANDWFGYAAGELVGEPIEKLVPAEARPKHVRYRTEYSECLFTDRWATKSICSDADKMAPSFP